MTINYVRISATLIISMIFTIPIEASQNGRAQPYSGSFHQIKFLETVTITASFLETEVFVL